jgi:hypothetical protein
VAKPAHGTANRYSNYGCRCGRCRKAWGIYYRQRREAMREGPVPESAHGTWSGYSNYKCRCERCRGVPAAARAKAKRRRKRAVRR